MQKSVKKLRPGDWIAAGPGQRWRVVEVSTARWDTIKVRHDFGNGGEPATSWFDADESVIIH